MVLGSQFKIPPLIQLLAGYGQDPNRAWETAKLVSGDFQTALEWQMNEDPSGFGASTVLNTALFLTPTGGTSFALAPLKAATTTEKVLSIIPAIDAAANVPKVVVNFGDRLGNDLNTVKEALKVVFNPEGMPLATEGAGGIRNVATQIGKEELPQSNVFLSKINDPSEANPAGKIPLSNDAGNLGVKANSNDVLQPTKNVDSSSNLNPLDGAKTPDKTLSNPSGSDILSLPEGRTATERRNSPGLVTGGADLPNIDGRWLKGTDGNLGNLQIDFRDRNITVLMIFEKHSGNKLQTIQI
jgi:hypothetical protein